MTNKAGCRKASSSQGLTCMQVSVSYKGYVFVVPMKISSEFPKALRVFAKEVVVTLYFIADPHPSQNSKEVRHFATLLERHFAYSKILQNGKIDLSYTLACLRKQFERTIMKLIVPLFFGDYCAERRVTITNMTAKTLLELQGQNSHMVNFSKQSDISNIYEIGWYECVYAKRRIRTVFTHGWSSWSLSRTGKNGGNKMMQWVLNINGQVDPQIS